MEGTPPAAEASRVLLVRHGETEYNRTLRCQGWTDQPLNETGHDQAAQLGRLLRAAHISRVVASPLARARETAEWIAREHEIEPELHEGLRELHHGRLEGVPFAELDDHVPGLLAQWKAAPHEVAMPEGETLEQLQARAWSAFEHVTKPWLQAVDNGGPQGDLVVVAHALTIATLLCRLERCDLAQMRQYRLSHCGYWELRWQDGWVVHDCNGPMPMDTRV